MKKTSGSITRPGQLLLCLLATLLLLQLEDRQARAQLSDDLQVSGYLQGMPVWIGAELPPPVDRDSFWEARFQNRLNLRWDASTSLVFHWQMRTRVFAGDLVEQIPFYADAIVHDDGFFNLSWMPVRQERWLLHYIPDRLYTEWHSNDWTVRVGRQRINWGINMVTNPNDIFNIYSFYEFDYPERPGSDAIRVQRYTGTLSRWEVAVRPARDLKQSTAAFLYAFNRNGYDIQVLAGYYRNRIAAGGGWAGSIDRTGFKGEVMIFTDLEESDTARETNIVLALSADHMFDNSLFLVVEGLYNQAGGQGGFLLAGDTFSADNPSLSRFQLTGHASYPFSPILNGALATIWYPDEKGLFFSPSITWSVHQDLDLNLLTQLFAGSSDSPLSDAGQVVAASLTWNF